LRRRIVELAVVAGEAILDLVDVPAPQVLLVLGHMRSGSTLLLHLLINHPQIAGLGERNATYRSVTDLGRLVVATRLRRRMPLRPLRYVVDQVNHSRFTPSLSLLENPRVRLLFLVRHPAASVASLLDLTRTYYKPWSVAQAVDYYVERVDTLADYACEERVRAHAAFLTYEDLTERTRETLSCLQLFLGTEPSFEPTYRLHDFSGKRGDPSANIVTGRVVRPVPKDISELPAQEVDRATRSYRRCLEAMAAVALLPQHPPGAT
jgi:sulfotransferase family protein